MRPTGADGLLKKGTEGQLALEEEWRNRNMKSYFLDIWIVTSYSLVHGMVVLSTWYRYNGTYMDLWYNMVY